MHHAEQLIQRIIFLEGTPDVSRLNSMKIGKTVPKMIDNDQEAELAVRAYNGAICLAHNVDDQFTVDPLTDILKVEEGHVAWGVKQRTQIEQIGLENYLSYQTDGASGE